MLPETRENSPFIGSFGTFKRGVPPPLGPPFRGVLSSSARCRDWDPPGRPYWTPPYWTPPGTPLNPPLDPPWTPFLALGICRAFFGSAALAGAFLGPPRPLLDPLLDPYWTPIGPPLTPSRRVFFDSPEGVSPPWKTLHLALDAVSPPV